MWSSFALAGKKGLECPDLYILAAKQARHAKPTDQNDNERGSLKGREISIAVVLGQGAFVLHTA